MTARRLLRIGSSAADAVPAEGSVAAGDGTRRPGEDGRGLPRATAGLLALALVGGGLAVASGWNTPAEAWSGAAVLAAPLPMMAAQAVLALTAARRSDRRG